MSEHEGKDNLLQLSAQVVAAYVGNNDIAMSEIPTLIRSVYSSLSNMDSNDQPVERPQPAIAIKKSITPDYIICLEDGKKLKMLKRHLKTAYGMTPEDYREKWGLPGDYPMVAPNYARHRSSLAKKIGLGTRGK